MHHIGIVVTVCSNVFVVYFVDLPIVYDISIILQMLHILTENDYYRCDVFVVDTDIHLCYQEYW